VIKVDQIDKEEIFEPFKRPGLIEQALSYSVRIIVGKNNRGFFSGPRHYSSTIQCLTSFLIPRSYEHVSQTALHKDPPLTAVRGLNNIWQVVVIG
jgi:hypothetical protein